jgi:putative ABC transport system permease protein
MTFNSPHDTAAGDGVDAVSADTLGLAAGVVGDYGTLPVFLASASTLTVGVRRRAAELELLRRSVPPAQLRRMVVGEAVAVALAGRVPAAGPALLGVFQDSRQVAESVACAFGPVALGSGVVVTLPAAAGAAFLAVRRATRPGERHGLSAAHPGRSGRTRAKLTGWAARWAS